THIPRTNAVGTFIYTREAKDGACNDWVSCSGEWVLTVIQASITGTDRICIGATTQLSSTIDGTWMSNNTNVASVTNEGLVTGLMEGAAAFTFTARDINFQATTALVFVSGEMLPEVNNIVAKTDLSGTPYILILPNPTGDLSFQWYHNGNPIYGATGQFF
ncbi:MAG: Ig-like domain-containing protein, partial [Bacteroidales bacterium]|nr:Ig-like domain-containing protein [Bacteroidales bacterium]